jgi:hypothetical protein
VPPREPSVVLSEASPVEVPVEVPLEVVLPESDLSDATPAGLDGAPTGLMAGQAAVPIRSKRQIAIFFMPERPIKTIIVRRRQTKCFGCLTP